MFWIGFGVGLIVGVFVGMIVLTVSLMHLNDDLMDNCK